MATISDLPQDLIEEILSRVPITCRGRVRSTCKRWNVLSNDQSFIKKHCCKAAKELLVIMLDDSGACLMNLNLHNPKILADSSIKLIGNFSAQVKISQIFHCDGLLLCIPRDDTRPLVVCNPYLGQVRLVQPIKILDISYVYAIGYDNRNNHKILRLFDSHKKYCYEISRIIKYEIYDFETDSWKVFEDTLDCFIQRYGNGKSLKGYTYFVAHDTFPQFLIRFDFTTERFGPRLLLPFDHASLSDPFILSTVREEQLAVLLLSSVTNKIEIWVTTKVEPDAVSWIPFLKVEQPAIRPITRFWFEYGTFFVDEKTKVELLFHKDIDDYSRTNAYVFGEDGFYRVMDLGTYETRTIGCSYAPSSVQIQ